MWTYEQKTGRMLNPSGKLVGTGYAGGNQGKNPEGINNPEMQNLHDIGPLPQGRYLMHKAFDHPRVGKFAIFLEPMPENEMFGRSGFFCHGAKIGAPPRTSSDGCVIQLRPVREAMDSSPDRYLEVVSGDDLGQGV